MSSWSGLTRAAWNRENWLRFGYHVKPIFFMSDFSEQLCRLKIPCERAACCDDVRSAAMWNVLVRILLVGEFLALHFWHFLGQFSQLLIIIFLIEELIADWHFINLINDRYARLNIHSPERQNHFRVINVNSSSRLLNLTILAKGSGKLWNVYSNTICNDLVYAYRLNARAFCATFCVPERQAVPLRWIRTTALEFLFTKNVTSTPWLNFSKWYLHLYLSS